MSRRQHHKGRKRPRSWHHTWREDRRWRRAAASVGLLVIIVCGPVRESAVRSANAAVVSPFYVAAHYAGSRQSVPRPARFAAIVGWPTQHAAGVPFWEYMKGSRTSNAHLPERWYLHAKGVRVRDAKFGYFVMNPARRGWERHVAASCERRCFIDGIGPTSIRRTVPSIAWTVPMWEAAAARLITHVRAAGVRVLPNSIGSTRSEARPYLAASGGRGSTEGFTPQTAHALLGLGRIWVQEVGDCQAKYTAYRASSDGNDHFSCHEHHTAPWDYSWWRG